MSRFMNFRTLDEKLRQPQDHCVFDEEPHIARRQAILKKYPEIKKLMGYDPKLALWVTLEVALQVVSAYIVSVCDFFWFTVVFLAYFCSGYINHSLGSAIHEIGHNLAFGHSRPLPNRALGMFANLPMGIPISVTYKKYHADHHRYMGQDPYDVDIPMKWETVLFRNPLTKTIWLVLNPLLHGIRPYFKSPKPVLLLEIINFFLQMAFNSVIYYLFGLKAIAYLVLGTLLALGLHPTSGHFISEHYMVHKGQATHSYYGSLNYLTYNMGYHNEHHDFPYIPGSRLPEVRRIASEFYDNIPHHTSWCKVLWAFIWYSDMGPGAHGVGYLRDDIRDIKKTQIVGNGKAANGHANGVSKHQD